MLKNHTTARRFRALNRDSAPHLIQCLLDVVRSFVQTRMAGVLAWWWGVHIGHSCRFYGLPLFRRLPGSRITIGKNCQFRSSRWSNLVGINRPCMISTLSETAQVRIGNECGFSGTIIGSASSISIGNRVMCGANVTITDTDWHPTGWRDRMKGHAKVSPVVIGNDVWLGMNVTVLKGVEIGDQSVIGAGSVVTRSVPPRVIAAGDPAVVVRELVEDHVSECPVRSSSLVEEEIGQ
jgi:acetyltransferase-like isoleucine patch superfamily enzyme